MDELFHHEPGHSDAVDAHDDFLPPTDLGSADGADHDSDGWSVNIDPHHLDKAIYEAATRAHYDPTTDKLTPAFVSDIQGITAEYLVADALNDAHDGLQYQLFADPTHPDVDIAGFDANGNIVRLLQVKATASSWYAEGALKPGIEVITSSDSWSKGLLRYDLSSSELRSLVERELQT